MGLGTFKKLDGTNYAIHDDGGLVSEEGSLGHC
jgi:hypothetical protein